MRNDKRRSVRRPVDCTAWIARQGKPLEACVIADVSDKGARLDVMDVDTIPDEFMLFLSQRGTPRRRCRVAWRANGQVGVRFEAASPAKKNARAKVMRTAQEASLQPEPGGSGDTTAAAGSPGEAKEPA